MGSGSVIAAPRWDWTLQSRACVRRAQEPEAGASCYCFVISDLIRCAHAGNHSQSLIQLASPTDWVISLRKILTDFSPPPPDGPESHRVQSAAYP